MSVFVDSVERPETILTSRETDELVNGHTGLNPNGAGSIKQDNVVGFTEVVEMKGNQVLIGPLKGYFSPLANMLILKSGEDSK